MPSRKRQIFRRVSRRWALPSSVWSEVNQTLSAQPWNYQNLSWLAQHFCCTQSSKLPNSIPEGKVEILKFSTKKKSGRRKTSKIPKQLFWIHVSMWKGGLGFADLGKLDVLWFWGGLLVRTSPQPGSHLPPSSLQGFTGSSSKPTNFNE